MYGFKGSAVRLERPPGGADKYLDQLKFDRDRKARVSTSASAPIEKRDSRKMLIFGVVPSSLKVRCEYI